MNLNERMLPHFTVDLLDRREMDLASFDSLARDLFFDANEQISRLRIIATEERMYVFSRTAPHSRGFKAIYGGGQVRHNDFKCAANLDIDHSKKTRVISGGADSLEVMGFLARTDSDIYKKGTLLEALGTGFTAE